jgi:hypothetical protein
LIHFKFILNCAAAEVFVFFRGFMGAGFIAVILLIINFFLFMCFNNLHHTVPTTTTTSTQHPLGLRALTSSRSFALTNHATKALSNMLRFD